MVSAISFTGTFKVNNNDKKAFYKFQNYALDMDAQKGVKTKLEDKVVKKGGFGNFNYRAEQTLIVPDSMDIDVETFCANNGIEYKKYETEDLLNPEAILSRIDEAPKGYKKVEIDTEKLEKLSKNQDNNFDHCKRVYNKHYYSDKIDTMLKSGDKIPATTLVLKSHTGNEDLKRYVERYGVDSLNDEQIMTWFTQKTDEPDHCTYFALKDMGLNKSPVYVDNESYEAGKILGLF